MTGLVRKLRAAVRRILPVSWVSWMRRRRFRVLQRRNFGREVSAPRTRDAWSVDWPTETDFWKDYVDSSEFRGRLVTDRSFPPSKSQEFLFDLLAKVGPPLGKNLR